MTDFLPRRSARHPHLGRRRVASAAVAAAVAAAASVASSGAAAASAGVDDLVRPGALVAAAVELAAPADAIVLADGSLLVAESDRGRLRRFAAPAVSDPLPAAPDPAVILDPARRPAPPPALVAAGSVDGFERPVALGLGDDGSVLVLDAATRTLEILDGGADGPRRTIELPSLVDPRRLAVDGDTVLIADAGRGRVLRVAWRSHGSATDPATTELVTADPAFTSVTAVAVAGDGRIALAGTVVGEPRIAILGPGGREITRFGDFGPFPGLLEQPRDLRWDGGRLLVVDRGTHRLQWHEADGTPVLAWGIHARRPHESGGVIHYPEAIAVDPAGRFIVLVEPFEDRVQVFAADPAPVDAATALRPPYIPRDGHFGRRLAADGDALILAEPDAHRVHLFDLRRETPIRVGDFGERGRGPGLLLRTEGLALDVAAGRIDLGDTVKRRLQGVRLDWSADEDLGFRPGRFRFARMVQLDAPAVAAALPGPQPLTPSAIVRLPGGGRLLVDTPGDRLVRLDGDGSIVAVAGGRGREPGRLRRPTSAALDAATGRLYVVDADNHRVQVFDAATLEPTGAWGAFGDGDAEFIDPFGIAVAPDGTVVVSDAGRHDVRGFEAGGRLLWRQGGRSAQRRGDGFWKPADVAVRPDGRIIVVDWGNHVARILDPGGAWRVTFGLGRPEVRDDLRGGSPRGRRGS